MYNVLSKIIQESKIINHKLHQIIVWLSIKTFLLLGRL